MAAAYQLSSHTSKAHQGLHFTLPLLLNLPRPPLCSKRAGTDQLSCFYRSWSPALAPPLPPQRSWTPNSVRYNLEENQNKSRMYRPVVESDVTASSAGAVPCSPTAGSCWWPPLIYFAQSIKISHKDIMIIIIIILHIPSVNCYFGAAGAQPQTRRHPAAWQRRPPQAFHHSKNK